MNTGHERASITYAHRGGWRYGALGQSCGLPLRPPIVVLGERYLLGRWVDGQAAESVDVRL